MKTIDFNQLSDGHNVHFDVVVLQSEYLLFFCIFRGEVSEQLVVLFVNGFKPANQELVLLLAGLIEVLNNLLFVLLPLDRNFAESWVHQLQHYLSMFLV